MEKTKFGVSAALISMLCYFTGYFNFTACIILLVAVCVWSDSIVAKKNAAQAAVLSAIFSLILVVLNRLSGFYMSAISTVCTNWFDWYEAYDILNNFDVMGMLSGLVGFVELVVMFILVIMSIKGKNIKIPVVSKLVDKHMGNEAQAEEV